MLAPGETVTATAAYATTQADVNAGRVDNTARATATAPAGEPAEAIDATTVSLLQDAGLALTKTGGIADGAPLAGDEVRYEFLVENTGNVTIDGIAIADELPGLSEIAFGEWPGEAGVLDPGEQVTASAAYPLGQADLDLGRVDNLATASGTAPGEVPVAAIDAVTVPLPAAPGLAVVKDAVFDDADAAKPGSTIVFTFDVENTGNVTVDGTRLLDELPGLGDVEFGAWPGEAGTLAPGEHVTAMAAYALTEHDVDAGRVYNSVEALGEPVRGGDAGGSDDVTVAFTAAPEPPAVPTAPEAGASGDLAHTGFDGGVFAALAGALIAAGLLGLLLVATRRRRAEADRG